jgi:hypothetical protein
MMLFSAIFWSACCLLIIFGISGVARWGRRLLASQERIATAVETLARKSEGTGPG